MKIMVKDTKECGKLLSNRTLFADMQFSGVKTEEEDSVQGENQCGTFKMIQKGFLLSKSEKPIKEWL